MSLPRYSYADASRSTVGHVDFWAGEKDDEYTHVDIHDYIESQLDIGGPWPSVLEVFAYRRVVIGPLGRGRIEQDALDQILEGLDEDGHGDPNGETTPTPGMRRAAKAFVAAVLADYVCWDCVPCFVVLVDVGEWVAEHRPHWLREQDGGAL